MSEVPKNGQSPENDSTKPGNDTGASEQSRLSEQSPVADKDKLESATRKVRIAQSTQRGLARRFEGFAKQQQAINKKLSEKQDVNSAELADLQAQLEQLQKELSDRKSELQALITGELRSLSQTQPGLEASRLYVKASQEVGRDLSELEKKVAASISEINGQLQAAGAPPKKDALAPGEAPQPNLPTPQDETKSEPPEREQSDFNFAELQKDFGALQTNFDNLKIWTASGAVKAEAFYPSNLYRGMEKGLRDCIGKLERAAQSQDQVVASEANQMLIKAQQILAEHQQAAAQVAKREKPTHQRRKRNRSRRRKFCGKLKNDSAIKQKN